MIQNVQYRGYKYIERRHQIQYTDVASVIKRPFIQIMNIHLKLHYSYTNLKVPPTCRAPWDVAFNESIVQEALSARSACDFLLN